VQKLLVDYRAGFGRLTLGEWVGGSKKPIFNIFNRMSCKKYFFGLLYVLRSSLKQVLLTTIDQPPIMIFKKLGC
jgi:hypothetical protein